MKLITPMILYLAFSMTNLNAADLFHPRPFQSKFGKAVFADFQESRYEIVLDAQTKRMAVKASIRFVLQENGFPVFDSYFDPMTIKVDGDVALSKLVETPQGESTLRILSTFLESGIHEMEISTIPNDEMCRLGNSSSLNCELSMGDNEPRGFLEYYMPASFEFDHVKMKMAVKILNNDDRVKLYTNGSLSKLDENHFYIEFPEHYTSSSIFLHVVSEKNVVESKIELSSIDGRTIPITAYYLRSDKYGSEEILRKLMIQTQLKFYESELDFGPYPHDKMIIYNDGGESTGAGMEFCGAMRTDLVSLNHEILHSWIGRGIMPANGNAAWIDESLVTWIDGGSKRVAALGEADMHAQSTMPYYKRENGSEAYSSSRFFGYLDMVLRDHGGLKPFLKDFIIKRKHTVYTNEDFIEEMGQFYGQDLRELFKKYTAAPFNILKT